MNNHTLVKAHQGIIYLFLTLLIIKVVLLFVNIKALRTVRNKTKVVEMILGTAILVTGLLLMHQRGWMFQNWITVKLIIFILGIPLAIMAMRKENKGLALVALSLFVFAYLLGTYQNRIISHTDDAPVSTEYAYGHIIYSQDCAGVHAALSSAPSHALAVSSSVTVPETFGTWSTKTVAND